MWQDLCWPKPTYPSLSLAFIRGEKKEKGGDKDNTGGRDRNRRREKGAPKKKEHAFHKTRAAELFEVGLSRASGSLS